MDDFGHSSSPSRLLGDAYSCFHCIPSISSPFLLLANTCTSRQSAYMETPSERRARLEFLQKEKNKEVRREEDRARSRVAGWVQSQVENSAFMVMVAAAQKQEHRRKSHSRRKEPRIAGQRSGSPLRFSYIPSDDEEEQNGIQVSKCQYSSPAGSPSSKRLRRTRRLASSTSSLDSIPEE